jgi:dienelactone hydrolase
MSQEIVLLHSALGLRPAILDWATWLRAAGHRVHTPDVLDGETFTTVEEAIRRRDAVGIPELIRRTWAAMADLPAELVFVGWSAGAAAAELLAATRPGAKAAILLHGVVPLAVMGAGRWPASVPVQIHYAKNDPWVPEAGLQAFRSAVASAGSPVEVFTYDGGVPHMFDDAGLPGHAPDATALMRERIAGFLAQL